MGTATWDQSTAKRGSNEIGSFLLDLIKRKLEECPEVRRIIFFSDKCGGQTLNPIYIHHVHVCCGHTSNRIN